ncbi:tyrosine-type recombinase/integrase [Kitasatospora sp. NPDC088264]|uniref:tyrosine-type recombinase/integrase n=1 Tax=Kitasatospora sp. NPDC088264 TaxID=3155296 RepID=UPI003438F62E
MTVAHDYAELPASQVARTDWAAWLADRLDLQWRTGEWDPGSLLFTTDLDSPRTRAFACRVTACGVLVESPASRCEACRAVSARRGHPADFDTTHTPSLPAVRQPNVGDGLQPGRSQFALGDLSTAVRAEILYCLQRRDEEDRPVVPALMRRIVRNLPPGLSSLMDLGMPLSITHLPKTTYSLVNDMQVRLRRARVQYDGVDPTLGDVWDCALVGLLSAPNRRYPAASGHLDFRPIRQRWLREIVKEYGRAVRPTVSELRRTANVTALASNALASRPAAERPQALALADMTVVVEAIEIARNPKNGSAYSQAQRRAMLGWWRRLLQYARLAGLMDDIPGVFALSPELHGIEAVDMTEDESGRAIPEHVIARLDQYLPLMGAESTYKHAGWQAGDFAAMYQEVYRIIRDTGRRPEEATSLKRDCLQWIDGKPSLIYDNRKRRRYGRRLPISPETARHIQQWQKHRDSLPEMPGCEEWLFPAPGATRRSRVRYLTAHYFSARVFRDWVDGIPELLDNRLDDNGDQVPYRRSETIAYGLRHAYAQRHADAGTAIDVLCKLMDHRSLDVTMGYYTVSQERRRKAVETVAVLAADRHGNPRGSNDPLAYELRSVAVPNGGCTKPSNVKAGGGHCRIRFQCAGCDFYEPDPSYRPALEQTIADLRADREAATAMGAADWVLANFEHQLEAYAKVLAEMDERLAGLSPQERDAVEAASKELRKVRASQAFFPGDTLDIRRAP